MSFPSIIQRIQHVQNYFQGPHIEAKGILEYYLYLFTPKISQDFPTNSILSYISQTKDSIVVHKENNVKTHKVENI